MANAMRSWPVQDAKARFSELVDACLAKGPQVVTRRGTETAVLVAADEWRRSSNGSIPTLKALLLDCDARTEMLVPPRATMRLRSPPRF